MTVAQAREITNRRLVFGDTEHIDAIQLLEVCKEIEKRHLFYRTRRRRCPECPAGNPNEACELCNGSGMQNVTLTPTTMADMTRDELMAFL